MPEFENPFKLKNSDNDISPTTEEIITAIRQAICLEHGAIAVYKYIADNCKYDLVARCMRDLANEETVHVGELTRLIFYLDKNEAKLYQEGAKETEDQLKK